MLPTILDDEDVDRFEEFFFGELNLSLNDCSLLMRFFLIGVLDLLLLYRLAAYRDMVDLSVSRQLDVLLLNPKRVFLASRIC